MSATIEDVARRASVSVATVSRALRGLPNVAPATRQRVLDAARDLEYVPHPSASRLAGGRSHTVGLVVPLLGQWYYSRLFSGAEAVAAAAGYDLLPFSTSGPGGIESFLEQLPFRKRVDGLIVADTPIGDAPFRRLMVSGVPLVTLGMATQLVPGVAVDNVAAARLAVGHLLGLGHRRIAMIGGLEGDDERLSAAGQRFAGFRAALEAAGLDVDPRLIVPGNFTLLGGAEAMHDLLAVDDPPTAVFTCSDEMAIGAMQVARDAGWRIPEDLSVVGFDDHDVAEYIGLTTVRQDIGGQGERVTRLLIDVLAGSGHDPGVAVHPTRLMVRRTTGSPRGGAHYRW